MCSLFYNWPGYFIWVWLHQLSWAKLKHKCIYWNFSWWISFSSWACLSHLQICAVSSTLASPPPSFTSLSDEWWAQRVTHYCPVTQAGCRKQICGTSHPQVSKHSTPVGLEGPWGWQDKQHFWSHPQFAGALTENRRDPACLLEKQQVQEILNQIGEEGLIGAVYPAGLGIRSQQVGFLGGDPGV